MDPANEFQPLMDDIFREKVRRARAEKALGILSLGGIALFESALERMRAGIRCDFPAATDAEVEVEIRRRLDLKRRIDERGFYQRVE